MVDPGATRRSVLCCRCGLSTLDCDCPPAIIPATPGCCACKCNCDDDQCAIGDALTQLFERVRKLEMFVIPPWSDRADG